MGLACGFLLVLLAACLPFEAQATDCLRCQYTSSDNDLIYGPIVQGLAALGIPNEEKCKTAPSGIDSTVCAQPDAYCGTVEATLKVNVKQGDNIFAIELKIFSRDCFPDVSNPGVNVTQEGCFKAENYDEFFAAKAGLGFQKLPTLTAQLDSQTGCICFCSGDGCNDRTSFEDEDCAKSEDVSTGQATSCLRCQYTSSDNALVFGPFVQGLAALGIPNEEKCKTAPSEIDSTACAQPDAYCGTVEATLKVNVKQGDNTFAVDLNVFSRGCFPDVSNPGVSVTQEGCFKAENYDEFFAAKAGLGFQKLPTISGQLASQTGCVCFCSGDGCNDRTSFDDEDCAKTGGVSTVLSSVSLMLLVLAALFC